uniref:von Willebrand factor A domain containing 5B1 n=1 Tax=Pavo cristatus TaxID=9049 RepID=A0A8C9L3I1_PAVCR
MPGLINQSSHCPLLLTASEVTSCVSGYALGMTASLTYRNLQAQPCKEGCGLGSLERRAGVGIWSRAGVALGGLGNGVFCGCDTLIRLCLSAGRIVMDEDLERIAFVANLGTIPPLESVSIFISTSSELQTLPSGAVRVLLPAVCVPRVPQPSLENTIRVQLPPGDPGAVLAGRYGAARDAHTHHPPFLPLCGVLWPSLTTPWSLHAGVESPTHEIRADADPTARSAKSIVITLANRHTFDRPVEILIHPSEPHMPHILMERGDMTPAEYEQHLKGKNDFIKGTKKDPSAEKKVREIIRKRLHKDIPHHPVVMLNFCPELSAAPADLQKAAGEFIFLVDCSGSSTSIGRAKDALLVALKSLMPACLFNIITFGSAFKILFPASRTYCESLAVACESIRRMHADTGSPNVLSPLKWIVRQPIRRGHPRLLFLLSHGAVGNTGMVLELLRNHACSTRCYSFGIGPHACRRLVQGAAAVSGGIAEFLAEGERLQPKVGLHKAMAPVLSDVLVEWVFPESTEVLVSPLSPSCLFPGDRLVGYSIICDTSLYVSKPRAVSATLLPLSLSSLAETRISPPGQIGREPLGPECLRDTLQVCPSRGVKLSIFAFPSPSLPPHASPPPGSAVWAPAGPPCCSRAVCPPATAPRPHQHLTWLWDGVQGCSMPACSPHPTAGALGSRVTWERDLGGVAAQHPSFTFETETSSDWEPQDWDSGATRGSPRSPRSSCKAVVKGLRGGEPMQWEITFDLPALLRERDGQEEGEEDVWSETFHQLAARAVIRDLELLAERERDIEHGNGASASCSTIEPWNIPGRFQVGSDAAVLPSLQIRMSPGCHPAAPRCPPAGSAAASLKVGEGFQGLSPGQGTPGPSSTVSGGPFGGWESPLSLHGMRVVGISELLVLLQVSLQLACGAFLMNSAFCEAVSIPMEKLRWTSPFSCHRLPDISKALKAESELSPPAITIRRSRAEQWDASISEADSTDVQTLLLDVELQKQTEPEGMLWATAVALAWLEHSSASHFTEWELVAAKASLWLGEQDFPQGCSLAAVKSAAQQLFVLLRHWDENLEFNLLCYNPGSV